MKEEDSESRNIKHDIVYFRPLRMDDWVAQVPLENQPAYSCQETVFDPASARSQQETLSGYGASGERVRSCRHPKPQ